MPKLTYRPIYEGADIESVMLGGIEVGRISRRGRSGKADGKAAWIFWLPGPNGRGYSDWREEKSYLAARNAMLCMVGAWIDVAGLEQPLAGSTPPDTPEHPTGGQPMAPATQPDLFGATHV
jgi:hypothetical protein